ncbi:MAG TPA: hypothetical protein VFC54_08985 [Pseudolabrys sp.]|nr:hypothetical protein [Pseudolabrys sp.]
MPTARRLRRQAATCAELAAVTHDDEGRERYLRLERIYLQLADAEEPNGSEPGAYSSDSNSEPARYRAN